MAVIEVYPAATLKAHGHPSTKYKNNDAESRAQRNLILERLDNQLVIRPEQKQTAMANADALDAIVCALAGQDFLAGTAVQPGKEEVDLAQAEGWIWTSIPSPQSSR